MARPVRETLTPQQLTCIQELVMKDITGKTNEDIAEELGVNIATLYRWKKTKIFNDKLIEVAEEFQKSFLADTYSQLRGIINNPRSAPAHKLKGIELMLKNQGRITSDKEEKVSVSVNVDANEVLQRLGIINKADTGNETDD